VDPDQALVIGIIIGALSIPAVIGAFSEGRPPRSAAILFMIAAGLIVTATFIKPGGYTFNEIPDTVAAVVSGWLN
jgi:hypothetical protein